MTIDALGSLSFGSFDPAGGDRPGGALRILCVLPTLNPYGGVVSVVNALNLMIDDGHHVTIVSLSRHRHDLVFPKTEPMYLADWEGFPPGAARGFDVLLATSWETVPIVAQIHASHPSASTFYYVQDFEPDFYAESDAATRQRALDTYAMIDKRFVKTEYLRQRLTDHGSDAALIPPGMDLDVFYPRSGPPSTRPMRVLAMARPTPDDHRGYQTLMDVFRQLSQSRPDLDLVVFGTDELPMTGVDVDNRGRVPPSELPELYSSSRIFVDTSRFHGFGRTGAEALACGTAAVLSDSGGISAYARHGENALVVPVGDVAATVEAVETLAADADLADRLSAQGVQDVARFSDREATSAIERLFRSAVATP